MPIVTTESGGIPEYVNNRCAFIIKRNEELVHNLSASIDKLISNDELRNQMGKESLEASKELTLDNYYFNFIKQLGV